MLIQLLQATTLRTADENMNQFVRFVLEIFPTFSEVRLYFAMLSNIVVGIISYLEDQSLSKISIK